MKQSLVLVSLIALLSACSHGPTYMGQVVAVDAPRDGRVTSVEIGPFTTASECKVALEKAIAYTKHRWAAQYADTPFPRQLASECKVVK